MAVKLPYSYLTDQLVSLQPPHKSEPQLPFQPAIDGIDTSVNKQKPEGIPHLLEDDQLSTSTTPSMARHSWEGFEELPFPASPAQNPKPPARLAPLPPREIGTSEVAQVAQTPNSTGNQWTALGLSPSDTASLPDYKSLHPSAEHAPSPGIGDLPFRRSQSVRLRQRHLQHPSPSSYDDSDLLKRGHANASAEREPPAAPTQWNVHIKLRSRPARAQSLWFPVFLSVEEGVISIRESIHALPVSGRLDDPDIFKEIILQHLHSLSEAVTKRFEPGTRISQLKLQQVSYLERRTFRRFFMYEHVTRRLTVCKFGFRDQRQLKEFQEAFHNAIRRLPVTRQQGVAYHANEVFVDVKDRAQILMSCDGAVLERQSQNRIMVQAYLTGAAECRLLLNDVESILKQTGNSSLLTTGISKPVHMERPEVHPCVDTQQFRETRDIVFHPVDGARFELIRCTVEPHLLPPVHVSALLEFRDGTIYLSSSIYVRRKLNLRAKPIKNLLLRFPIPPSWRNTFSTETRFGKKSVRSSSRGSFRRNVKSAACRVTTSAGSSKYIPELGAVVWEIGTYQHSTFQYHFMCEVDFRPGMQSPAGLELLAEVEYTVPGSSSGLSVRALKIDRRAEKWVRYEIEYQYKVQMYPELAYD